MRVLLAAAAILAVLAVLPVAAQVPDGDDPSTFAGDWYLISQNRTHAGLYGAKVTVARVGDTDQYEGAYAGGAAAPPCGIEVGDVIWRMDGGGGDFGATFGGQSLNADCGMRESNWFWVSGRQTLQWNHLEGDSATRVSGQLTRDDRTVPPDEVVGHWQVVDRAPHTGAIVHVTGSGITFEARVVEPADGACFESGDLFAELVFGLTSQPQAEDFQHTYDGRIADAACELGADATDVLRLSTPDGGALLSAGLRGAGWGDLVEVDGPSTPPVEPPDDDPVVVQRLAPFPIRGRWTDTRFEPDLPAQNDSPHGVVDVVINDGDDPNFATGYVATSRNPGACPPQNAIVWQVTAEDENGYTGFANLYGTGAAGCEVVDVVDIRIDHSRGDVFSRVDEVTVTIGQRSNDWVRTGPGVLVQEARRTGGVAADFLVWGVFRGLQGASAGFAQTEPMRLFLATEASFPDGLAVSSVSGVGRGFTLLLDPEDQSANTELVTFAVDELAALGFDLAEIVVAGGQAAVPDTALPTGDLPPVRRLEGPNRFATAAAMSADFFPDGVPLVYVATGANFPDALAGGAAGSVNGAPLLLVDGGRMPAETDPELRRLSPQRIVVLGGSAAIPDEMVATLGDYADEVVRAAGPTRFHTATAISQDTFPGGGPTVLIVPGGSFQEALIAGSAAWLLEAPLLLIDRSSVPDALAEEIDRLGATGGILLAGEDAVEQETVSALLDLFTD